MSEQQFDLVVKPAAGSVASNISELEAWVKHITEPYIGQVVTDDQAKFAKKDLAELRKLKTALEDERKKAKSIIMAPYTEFETLYKKAIASLDEAISGIDKQVKEIEAAAKQKRYDDLVGFIQQEARNIYGESMLIKVEKPEVLEWFMDPKWLLSSATTTSVQIAVREKLAQLDRDYDCILKTAPDPAAIDEYLRTGSLSMAFEKKRQIDEIRKMQEETEKVRTSETPVQDVAAPAEEHYVTPVADRIFFDIPVEPEDEAQKELMHIPAILVFPKYKKNLIREITTKLGIKILKP